MQRRNTRLWILYDFANSIATVAFFLYFSQWLVVERGVSDLWYNMIFVGSSALYLLTAPMLSAVSDQLRSRMPFLRWATIALFVFYLMAAVSTAVGKGSPLWSALAVMLAYYAYQLSFCFYNPLMNDLGPESKHGRLSGYGQTANWVGQITGILIALPLAVGTFAFFGQPGRPQALLATTVIFFLLALPMLLWFREGPRRDVRVSLAVEYRRFTHSFRALWRVEGMAAFLVGYFLFSDAVITAQNNFPIYMQQVFGVGDRTKSLLLLGILITSAIGAFSSGWIADRFGLRRTLLATLLGWIVIFPILGVVRSFPWFVVATIVMGLLYGAIWTITRAVMAYLAPDDARTHAFSYYTLAERFSTFVGPLAWGIITSTLGHLGPDRYRIAFISMTVFILLGFLIVRKIPPSPAERAKIAIPPRAS